MFHIFLILCAAPQTSINLGATRNSFYDSTDSDSSSSEDDDDDCDKTEPKMKKGKIVKEAFLAKRVQFN